MQSTCYQILAELLLERLALRRPRLGGGGLLRLALLVGEAGGLAAGLVLALLLGTQQIHLVRELAPHLLHLLSVRLAEAVEPGRRLLRV